MWPFGQFRVHGLGAKLEALGSFHGLGFGVSLKFLPSLTNINLGTPCLLGPQMPCGLKRNMCL